MKIVHIAEKDLSREIESLKVKISVITATYNAENYLPRLISSLVDQTDQDFEWIIADGASTDKTLTLLEDAKKTLKHVIIDSKPDCGLYDGLNRAIGLSKGDYYLVVGADDLLFPNAIKLFKRAYTLSKADLIVAKVRAGDRVLWKRKPSWIWLYGPPAIISSHSVGTLIKKELHVKYGFYDSKNYKVYADGAWLLAVLRSNPTIAYAPFESGLFSLEGVSNNSQFTSFVEQLRAQIANGCNVYLQTILTALRIFKWRNSIKNQLYKEFISGDNKKA